MAAAAGVGLRLPAVVPGPDGPRGQTQRTRLNCRFVWQATSHSWPSCPVFTMLPSSNCARIGSHQVPARSLRRTRAYNALARAARSDL